MSGGRYLASAMVVAACGFFAGTNLIAKLLASDTIGPALHPLQLAFGRFTFGTLLLSPLFLVAGRALVVSQVPWFYLIRSGCSVAALGCIFWSVGALPLGDVTAIMYSSPFFTLALAALILGERVGVVRWFLVAIGFAGVVLIAKPTNAGFASVEPMAFVALAAAMFIAAELIALRFIAQRDSTTTALFLTNVAGMIISGCLAPWFWRSLSETQWLLIFAIALVTVSGQALFIRAIAAAEASEIAPLFYTTLVYAIALGYFVFGEVPTPQSLVGASLIVACGLLVARR